LPTYHSFPTRRSSDLAHQSSIVNHKCIELWKRVLDKKDAARCPGQAGKRAEKRRTATSSFSWWPQRRPPRKRRSSGPPFFRPLSDRKSTRLNSSHDQI